MFKLVGSESFSFSSHGQDHRAVISIDPSGFQYTYSLVIDGKSIDKFVENVRRVTQTWNFSLDGSHHSVVLGFIESVSVG